MLYITDKTIKLNKTYIPGIVKSVEVTEAGSIYVAQDSEGKIKSSQAVGYENAKVNVSIILEEDKGSSVEDQIKKIQQIFKKAKQEKPNLIPIVNKHCAARGISKVYFKEFTTKENTSNSMITGTLVFLAISIGSVKIKKKKSKTKGKSKDKSNNNKSKKDNSKSPAKDTRNTSSSKKSAKAATKKK